MNRFRKVTSGNLKIGILLVALATLNFHELFEIKFDLNSGWLEEKSLFLKGFIIKNPRCWAKVLLPQCKIGLR